MGEKEKDLNLGEGTPDGTGQPEEKKPLEVKTPEDGGEDDKVILTKEEHQKILEERDNYKAGLLSYKEKEKGKKEESKTNPDILTKKDFQKINEKKAVKTFVDENPELESKWADFVKFYRNINGKDSVEDIIKDLDDARTLFLKHNPVKEDDKKAKAELSSEKAISDVPNPGGEKKESKSILTGSTPVSEWY